MGGAWVNTWGEHGHGLKQHPENLGKILEKYLWKKSFVKVASYKPATLLKMNFFTHIFQGFSLDLSYLLCSRIPRTFIFQSTFQWLLLLVLVITHSLVYSISVKILLILKVCSYSFLPYLHNLSHRLTELNVSIFFLIKLIFFKHI